MSFPLIEMISALWAETAMSLSLAGLLARKLNHRWPYSLVFLVLINLPVVPVGANHLSTAAIIASVLGEVSTLSLLLVLTGLLPAWRLKRSAKLLLIPCIAALTLYWSVLTYGPIDLYRLGYLHSANGKLGTVILLGSLALLSLMLPLRLVILIALACLSWSLGLQASTNLWDYLLDLPSVLIYLGLLISILRNRKHT